MRGRHLPRFYLAIALLALWASARAQTQSGEILVPCSGGNAQQVAPRLRAPQPVELPLYDDFSRAARVPTGDFWEQPTGVSVRLYQAVAPPTVGVGTFDAANAAGLIYPGAGTVSFPADTLTSLPITFSKPDDTTVYFSMAFQPGGYADAPAPGDSLMVDFYSPATSAWRTVWRASYDRSGKRIVQHFQTRFSWPKEITVGHENPEKHFFQMHIPVRGPEYLREGFKIRLRNYASVPRDATAPGRTANASHWHVDLVYLDRLRAYNDSTISDVGCTELPSLPFGPYRAIPKEALPALLQGLGKAQSDSIAFSYANLSHDRKVVGRRFSVEDLGKGIAPITLSAGSATLEPHGKERCARGYTYPWAQLEGKAVKIKFTAHLITGKATARNSPFRWNDTVRTTMEYDDAYAYDSGEPSTGYGIIGVGAERAAVAVRFDPIAPTAIRGVRIWFNPIMNPKDRKNVRLTVWEDEHGKPGRMLLQQLVSPPQKAEEQGQFVYYELDKPIRFSAPLHVGWVQTSADMLNVGFDRYAENVPRVHYRTTGTWESSNFAGALLLRVVCGGTGEYPDAPTGLGCATEPTCEVYPNPASRSITVRCDAQGARFSLFNLAGHAVSPLQPCETPVDVSALPRGLYIVRVVGDDGRTRATQRLILQ